MQEKSDLRWRIDQRLEFIEFRLFWKGGLKCSDPVEAFGVPVNQASTDLTQHIGLVLGNLIYNRRVRTYLQGSKYDRLSLMPAAGSYLTLISCVGDCLLDRAGAWIGQFLSYHSPPTPVWNVNAKTLRSVNAEIRNQRQSRSNSSLYPGRNRAGDGLRHKQLDSMGSGGMQGPPPSPTSDSEIPLYRGSSKPEIASRARPLPIATPTGTGRLLWTLDRTRKCPTRSRESLPSIAECIAAGHRFSGAKPFSTTHSGALA